MSFINLEQFNYFQGMVFFLLLFSWIIVLMFDVPIIGNYISKINELHTLGMVQQLVSHGFDFFFLLNKSFVVWCTNYWWLGWQIQLRAGKFSSNEWTAQSQRYWIWKGLIMDNSWKKISSIPWAQNYNYTTFWDPIQQQV